MEGLALLGTKWLVEDQRRQKWLMRLYLEGELKTLGEFSLAGMRSNLMDDSASEGGVGRSLSGFHRKKKLSDPRTSDGSDREQGESTPYGELPNPSIISDWIFGKKPVSEAERDNPNCD